MPETPLQPSQGLHYSTISDSDTNSNKSQCTVVRVGIGSSHGDGTSGPERISQYDSDRRTSRDEENGELTIEVPPKIENKKSVTWSDLPHKGQLALLTFARLSEPLVQSSLRVSGFYKY